MSQLPESVEQQSVDLEVGSGAVSSDVEANNEVLSETMPSSPREYLFAGSALDSVTTHPTSPVLDKRESKLSFPFILDSPSSGTPVPPQGVRERLRLFMDDPNSSAEVTYRRRL